MKKIIKVFVKVLIVLILFIGGFLGYLTATEYRPNQIEALEITNNQTQKVSLNTTYKAMTYNIGYAGLGSKEDFVMDGGSKGRPDSKEVVLDYLEGTLDILSSHESDFYFLQEVDLKARRSFNLNQVRLIEERLGDGFSSSFAYNFKANFVPFPVSFTDYIGHVESGLLTLSTKQLESSKRHQFPGEFSWPLRIANLKRAMMENTYEIENSDKKLIMVNLHMSAYDGDGSLRKAEMAYLKEFMVAQEALGNYVVIGGDFNQTFPEVKDLFLPKQDYYVAYPIEDEYLPSGYSFQIDPIKPTARLLNQPYDRLDENTQYYLIDGFIVSSNITALSVINLDYDFLYSDHNPVVLNFKLN
ncbi:MAG: hypothetical protein WCZ13_00780 [Acholeplasmataceae bacterium]